MAYHVTVTVDPLIGDGLTVSEIAAALRLLKPADVHVDCSGGTGRVLLASLQASGIPAHALEKRPRPALPEIQRAEELSREVDKLKADLEQARRDVGHLERYQRDVRILIGRLED